MNQTDTQQVTTDASRNQIAMAFGLTNANPRTEDANQVQPQATAGDAEIASAAAAVANAALATPAVSADAPAKADTAAAAAKEVATTVITDDSYAKAVEAIVPATAQAPVDWTDDAKKAFKSLFNEEDPVNFKKSIEERLTEAELVKNEYQKVSPLVQAFNSFSPALQKAFSLAMEGKANEAQEYLRDMPTTLFNTKSVEDIPQKDLINQYFPGKISNEQWEMLEDPESDEDLVDALETRIGLLHESAVEKYNKDVAAIVNEQKAIEENTKAQYEKYNSAVTSTISLAKNSPLGVLLDNGTKEQFSNGHFLSDFVEPDGTPKPQAATLLLYARHGQKLIEAAEVRGYNRGRSEGLQEATQRQPSLPPWRNRSMGDAPKQMSDEDRVKQILFGALTN